MSLPDLPPGTLFAGRYEVIRALAEASYLVVPRDGNLRRVLDLFPLPGDGTARERFLREARLLLRLDGPHTAQILDVGVDDGAAWLVRAHHEGEHLGELVARRGPLPYREMRDLLEQIRDALEEAEASVPGLVHGVRRLPGAGPGDRRAGGPGAARALRDLRHPALIHAARVRGCRSGTPVRAIPGAVRARFTRARPRGAARP